MMKTGLVFSVALALATHLAGAQKPSTPKPPENPAPLVVHEWGTITTRHRPDGTPEGHLNRITEAEVLPAFVHTYEPPPTTADPDKSLLKKPLVPGRPDVTMRLETPVLYFHLPTGARAVTPFDVSVRFRGGILWKAYFLPLTISVPSAVSRVLVGRIDLLDR